MLTPQGMRQRYLLGRYARKKYTETYELFDDDYREGQVYMQSTNVNRTLQSGYSELMGLYPPGKADTYELSKGERKSLEKGRSAPKIEVRDFKSINEHLDKDALPNGFVSVPIYTFSDHNVADDANFKSCRYVRDTVAYRRASPTNYQDYFYIENFVEEPLAEALGISDDVF